MSTGTSVNPKRSPRSSAARSLRNTKASYRPSSKTSTCPTRSSAATMAMASSSNTYGTTACCAQSLPPTTSTIPREKGYRNLPQWREHTSAIIDNYHNAQQDILETFVDRGQLQKLTEPTVLANGKRIPGLQLDHPRQLAVMHAVVRFADIAAGGTFTTSDLYEPALDALGFTASKYSLASLRYDLSKLRAKGLIEKVPRSRRYRLVGKGYSICLVFLKLFEKTSVLGRSDPVVLV